MKIKHDWTQSIHGGTLVQAMMLASFKPPRNCMGCGKFIGQEYYMLHKAGGAWHAECHFTGPTRHRKRLTKVGTPPSKRPIKVGKTPGFFR